MPSNRSDPTTAAVFMFAHAVSMALAGVLEGLYVTAVSGGGTWMAFDPNADRVGAFLIVAYALFRFAAFLTSLLAALFLLLGAYSLYVGHRRFVVLASVLGILVPLILFGLNLMTFNCCSIWLMPLVSAVPATALGLSAMPTMQPTPARETW